jgi:uncharacterized membrane protein
MSINQERMALIKSILDDETIAAEEDESLHRLLQEQMSKNPADAGDDALTIGQKAADAVARFAGSWGFIIVFFVVLLIWILLNAFFLQSFLHAKPFDPYPFILMNLILSCIAAIQAPIIMMSQNRQEQKDRQRAKNDYKVNLKAEIIIEDIHQKLDAIMDKQMELLTQLSATDKTQK